MDPCEPVWNHIFVLLVLSTLGQAALTSFMGMLAYRASQAKMDREQKYWSLRTQMDQLPATLKDVVGRTEAVADSVGQKHEGHESS